MKPAVLAPLCLAIVSVALVAATPGSTAPGATPRGVPRRTTDHFVFFAPEPVSDAEVSAAASSAEALWGRVARFTGREPVGPAIKCTLFRTLEDKGLATGYTLPAHFDPRTSDVFVALEPGFDGEADRVIATVLLRRSLGRPKVDLLEVGLSMYLAEGWRGRGFREWAAAIASAGEVDLERLLDNTRLDSESYLFARPLAGAFVDWAVEAFGRRNLVERYAEWVPSRGETAGLERHWRRYLDGLARSGGRDRRRGAPRPPEFQKGFCFAHEGYQVHNGYASRRADAALKKLAALGANAVSLTPFTYMKSAHVAAPLPFSHQTGAENDEAVIHAVLTARSLGLAVMIKPHVWLHGSWPGEVEMADEAGWDAFFDHYWRWIRHYALLAEMYDVEVLCVGVELSRAAVGRDSRWRELFGRVRRLYGGEITYAANWGEEFETVTFWDALDFVGISCYYPLSDRPDPSDEELRRGSEAALDRVEAVARRFGRRAIVTEVGFCSSPSPWLRPYERNRRAVPDEAAQARCYRAFFQALAGRDRIAGVYWWKWPSFLEYGGPRNAGFTPNGKVAEEVVKRWFATLAQ